MTQIVHGIRGVLSSPVIYMLFQDFLGAKKLRSLLVKEYFNLSPGKTIKILDIGCGTADILDILPENIEYLGFDASEKYIEFARNKYKKSNAKFFSKLVKKADINEKFDLVIAFGILHHLDDSDALSLFDLAYHALLETGRLVTFDPCVVKNQSWISTRLVNFDRGQNVRTPQQYKELSELTFSCVNDYHRNDMLYIPYDHAVLVCEK